MRAGADPAVARLVELSDGWFGWPVGALRAAGLPFDWLDRFACDPAVEEQQARERSARACAELVCDDSFAEAVQWQNPALVANWLGAYREALLAGEPDPRLARRDQREVLVATLAQRYCAKNETIGFFGPVAWARLDTSQATTCKAGSGMRRREVFLERHAVAAVADAIAADPRLRRSLPLRRHPLCFLRDGLAHSARGAVVDVSPLGRAVLQALDVPRSETELDQQLGDAGLAEELAVLEECELVLRDLPVPVGDRPERRLRARVEQLPASQARTEWLGALDRVDAAVAEVGRAAGDPGALAAALGGLGSTLGAICQPSLTGSGRRYGRTAVYEDCRSEVDVVIGADLLDALRAPLALLLRSASWLVAEVAREVVADLRSEHAALTAQGRQVSLTALTLAGAGVLSGAAGTAVHRVVADFTARWAEVLDLADDGGRLRTGDAADLVDALFPAAERIPWQAARQHSPDIMLRERPDGAAQWVLGELHLALNTLENRPFRSQADDLEELLALTRADFALGRIVPVWPASSPEVTSRTYPPLALDLPEHYSYWSYALDEGHPAGVRALPGSALRVLDEDGELSVLAPDGSWRRPVTEFLGEFLTALVVDRFHIRPPAAHRPRLLFDDVVIERETWQIPIAELPVGPADSGDYRRFELCAALTGLGCPRHLFASVSGQRKPVFVDLRSPLLVRALARLLRSAAEQDPAAAVKVVEMLPEPGALWLRNGEGRPVTSEFRLVMCRPASSGEQVGLPAQGQRRP